MSRQEDLDALETLCQGVGSVIGSACDSLDPAAGFALLMFEYGGGESWTTYVSNARREDIVALLRELADRLEEGLIADVGTGGRMPS